MITSLACLAIGLSDLLVAAVSFKLDLSSHNLPMHFDFSDDLGVSVWYLRVCVDEVLKKGFSHRRCYSGLILAFWSRSKLQVVL